MQSLTDMKNSIDAAKANDFTQYKDEITFAIEQEIVSRYFNQKGRIQKQLENDHEVKAAIDLLLDQERYQSILKSPA